MNRPLLYTELASYLFNAIIIIDSLDFLDSSGNESLQPPEQDDIMSVGETEDHYFSEDSEVC